MVRERRVAGEAGAIIIGEGGAPGRSRMPVSEAIGRTLVDRGVEVFFGLVGSGNFAVTNALHAAGAAFYSSRHEGGAVAMADGYARACGKVGVASVHQGPGFTNTLTALTESAKSRTTMLLLAADTPPQMLWSNFKIDQGARTVDAIVERVHGPETAAEDAARARRVNSTRPSRSTTTCSGRGSTGSRSSRT